MQEINDFYGFQVWCIGFDHYQWYCRVFGQILKSLAGVVDVKVLPIRTDEVTRLIVMCIFRSELDRNLILGTQDEDPDAIVVGLFEEGLGKGLILNTFQLTNPGSDQLLVRIFRK